MDALLMMLDPQGIMGLAMEEKVWSVRLLKDEPESYVDLQKHLGQSEKGVAGS